MKKDNEFINELKKSLNYLQSETNIENCKKCKEKCDRLSETIKEYYENTWMKDIAPKKAGKVEYSSGESTLHRGYYDPNPVSEYITGGIKRGKLISRSPKSGHAYYFDINNRIIYVESINKEFGGVVEKEIIHYHDDISIGVTYNTEGEVCLLAVCTYKDNKITEYLLARVFENKVIEYEEWDFEYSSDKVQRAKWLRFHDEIMAEDWLEELISIKKVGQFVTLDEFEFCYDENGEMEKYICREHDLCDIDKIKSDREYWK